MTDTRCHQCGASVSAGAKFCMACGADVSGEQASVATRMVGASGSDAPRRPRMSQADMMALLRNDTLGDYEILGELGRGGMATVYLAHDIQLDRKVAIKVLNPAIAQGEGMVERFRLEARTAAKLSHPHIIPIYAVRETEQLVYFVMKFVVGRPLDSIVKELAPLPIATVRTILTKVAEALGYAHRNGVVHRDIKPANIMLDAEGLPIVTDFGIAKVADRERLTITGLAIGTPNYMSPEQCNAGTITGASDQYSLGVMAYEMLTGRQLYDADSFVTIMFKHVHEPPPALASFGPHVPPDLAQAVVRMLQKSPRDRWEKMEDALPALRGTDASQDDAVRTQMIAYAQGGPHAELLARISTPRSPMPVIPRPSPGSPAPTAVAPGPGRRSRTRVLAAVAAVVVLAGVAGLATLRPWERAQRGSATAMQPPASDPAASAPGGAGPAEVATPEQAGGVDAPAGSVPPPTETSAPQAEAAPPAVRDVRIAGVPPTLAEGESVTLRAEVLDGRGRPLDRRVQWTSSDPAILSVGSDGVARAVAPGRAVISAVLDGRRAEVAIGVTAVVAGVVVTPQSGALTTGEAMTFTAAAQDRGGRVLADRPVEWQSSDERVAPVSSSGRVTALAAGTAVIRAVVDGQVGSARITVSAPVVTKPAETPSPPAVVEDPQEAIAAVVQAYARALESRNLQQVKALYPGLSPSLERRTRDALEAMEDLRIRLVPSAITVNGNTATTQVTGAWTYRGGKLDINNRYRLERRAADWVIVAIE